MEEKTIESKVVFAGRIITVKVDRVLLENDRTSFREVVLHPGAVAVLPMFENGDVVLVKQFRYPIKEVLIEVPAGKLDQGEDPKECALRELREETGIRAEKLHYVGFIYTSPGFSNEKIHLYIAEQLSQSEQELDFDEIVEAVRLPLKDALKMCMEGKITDAKTIALLSIAFLKRG